MADTYSGKLQGSVGLFPSFTPAANNGDGGGLFHLLPFIEQDNLYKASFTNSDGRNGNLPAFWQWNSTVQNARVKTYICPSDPSYKDEGGHSGYGQNGMVFREGYWAKNCLRFPASFTDGTSNTILYTDKYAHCYTGNYSNNYWPDWGPVFSSPDDGQVTLSAVPPPDLITPQIQPRMRGDGNGQCSGNGPSSGHTAGINVGLGDGSVRFVSGSITLQTWFAACTPAGGETLGSNW